MKGRNNKKKIILVSVVLLFVIALLVGVGIFGYKKFKRHSANELYEDLNKTVNKVSSNLDTVVTDNKQQLNVSIPKKNIDWNDLRKINPDIYAWIYVPDTDVDYPIVQHPDDDEYYFMRNLDNSYGYPGCIYTEPGYNKKDFKDIHTVIYGHNLLDGTMFTSLHNFEDPALVENNHYVYIYTEDKTYVYQIFGAYEYRAIHLLDNFDFSNEYVYEQYLKEVKNIIGRVANIRQDIDVTKNDRIITLCTCTTDDVATLRFLVQGVLLNP